MLQILFVLCGIKLSVGLFAYVLYEACFYSYRQLEWEKDTIACLASIKAMRKTDAVVDTIVVDNGSTNDSVFAIKTAHPWARIIKLSDNLGFTGGNNVGIREALLRGADYVWLLNNDTIVDLNALTILNAFEDESVGVVGSKIYFQAGHEYHKERYTKKSKEEYFGMPGELWIGIICTHHTMV